ncbi:hypothetical protein D877_gp15 [Edwardsiella phage KF-1]|uniref:Uncharacterized protein n=1 Tax=Edwardsiella phage KF-1 TaxID=1244856 RepID=K4PWR3_9CAUD|nr:hypothetical protein D877_gp15 [Edwardsiella phage KF-1]BAM63063.1 hypothetical protein [Edwardsiella phage KF-1]
MSKVFVWITKYNEYKLPRDMTTTHLYYSLRTIWNYFMPEELLLGGGIVYNYESKSTEYLVDAIKALYKELQTCQDLPWHLHDELSYIQPTSLEKTIVAQRKKPELAMMDRFRLMLNKTRAKPFDFRKHYSVSHMCKEDKDRAKELLAQDLYFLPDNTWDWLEYNSISIRVALLVRRSRKEHD